MANTSMFTRSKATVEAKAFILGAQYKFATATARKHNGEIGKNSKGFLKMTFPSDKDATACKKELDAWWDSNKTTIQPSSEHAPTSKGNPPTKMTLEAFIKANPSCTREQAREYGFEGKKDDLKTLKKKLGVR